MPNNDIWPDRDDEMLYPLDARASGRSRMPHARRRSGGWLSLLWRLIVLAAAVGGAYLWLYLPKEQQLRFTAQLLEQATESSRLLTERVAALEAQRQQSVTAKEAADDKLAAARGPEDWMHPLRERLTQALAPYADQRHLQLLPHEQGLAISLLMTGSPERHASASMSRDDQTFAGVVAALLAEHLKQNRQPTLVVAFRCLSQRARTREQRAAWRQVQQLAHALQASFHDDPMVRQVTAVGEPEWSWHLPSDDQRMPASCWVIDVRRGV